MRLPIEYGAMFRMKPKDLACIIDIFDQEMTANVRISIGNHGLKFNKEELDPNLDRGGQSPSDVDENEDSPVDIIQEEADPDLVSQILHHPLQVTGKMEDSIRETGIEQSFCLMCLHKYLNEMAIKYPEANDVSMYMGKNKSAFMIHTVPADFFEIPIVEGLKVFNPPEANHTYHRKSEREAVRKIIPSIKDEKWESSEDGYGNGVKAEDGELELEKEKGKEKLNTEDGDGGFKAYASLCKVLCMEFLCLESSESPSSI